MSTTNCGGLHIRTPKTDEILSPNIITQSIVSSGMRLGIIPETTIVGEFLYNIIVKNSSNNIIFQNSAPIVYTGYGNYLYITIPFTSLPSVGEIINIKLTSTLGCTTSTDYTTLSYTSSNDSTTTVNVNGIVNKYLKLKPSISANGYFKDNFYYFKCETNTDTDDECFIQFKQNTDLSKVLTALPTNTEIVSCPDSSDWMYVNTVCVSNVIPTTTSTSTTTLVPCATGLTLDNIIFTSGNLYKVSFTSTDVQSINWKLYDNSNQLIKSGNSGQLITSNFDADFGTLVDGTYKLTIQASNCSSNITNGTKIFTKGVPSSTTTSSGSTTTIPINTTQSFINYLKLVPVETVLGKYNPDLFPTISVINSIDPILNKNFPNWSISWKVEGRNFSSGSINKKTQNIGIPFMFDLLPIPYGGYGQRCIDYVYPQDPNTGQVWNSDTACTGSQYDQYFNNLPHTIANFSSALPFELRAGDGGGAGLDRITEWAGISDLSYFYEQGTIGAERFGFRDWVNGKANVGLSDFDNEATFNSDKSLAILLGLANKSTGYVFDQYANILQSVYIDPSQYPLDSSNPNSTYPQYQQLLDGRNGEPNSGNTGLVVNNVPSREFWNPTYKISIPSKFSGSKGVIDEPTILSSTEVSCISSATFRQGESYVYDTNGNTRVVNKFTLQANAQHMIARVIFSGETHKWYCVNRLNNRKMILQAKILCDQHQNGLLLSTDYANTYITNTALANKHFDRRHSFMIGAFVAFTGCEWNIWDRNQVNVNIDGYHGAFGIINLLYQRKTDINKSFVDLKPVAKFLLWDSEIAYGGSSIFVKDKANDYVMFSSKIPQRQFITPDGCWGGFLARPENTEDTSCRLRVSYNGNLYYYTITSDMWETVNPNYANTPLNQIPNSDKDYHYFLINLNSTNTTSTTTVSGSTTTTTSTTTVPTSGVDGFRITEPNKPQYYFSDLHAPSYYDNNAHVPAIHRSETHPESVPVGKLMSQLTMPAHYDKVNDLVWLENNYIKIGINLKRGGQIAWASLAGSNTNLVYNGYDGGFQIQLDAYLNPENYTQEGQIAGRDENGNLDGLPISYNVINGGDKKNNSISLVDYHATSNGYYVKLRPLHYPMRGLLSETYVEVTYTLTGRSIKCDYKYTSFRTDNQVNMGTSVIGYGWGMPSCFLVNTLNRYTSYVGNSPFTNDSNLVDDIISNVSTAGRCGDIKIARTSEKWGISYNSATGIGIGVYNPSEGGNTIDVIFKQCEVYPPDGAGNEFQGGFTFMQPNITVQVPNSANFIKTTTAYIMVGSPQQVRQEVYRLHNL